MLKNFIFAQSGFTKRVLWTLIAKFFSLMLPSVFYGKKMYSIQFSLFPAHINMSHNNDNVHIMCRKSGGTRAKPGSQLVYVLRLPVV